MSKPNDNPTPIVVASSVTDGEKAVEKQSLVKRGVNFVKSHKKTTIAVAGLVSLVGLSAIAGKKADSSDDQIADPEPTNDFERELAELVELEAEANNG